MNEQVKDRMRGVVIPALDRLGLQRKRPFSDIRDFIPFRETRDGAAAAGLSIGDYIETTYNRPGATLDTIERIAALGVFDNPVDAVCEIGPGSGRFLARTIDACHPRSYEIYETAHEWRDYLVATYPVTARPTDGRNLVATATASIDLAQAHKVFSCSPSLTIFRSLQEMVRVTRPGGHVVFDLVTEPCFTDEILDTWIERNQGYSHLPALIPRQFSIDYLERRGMELRGTFTVDLAPGITEYFVFRKT